MTPARAGSRDTASSMRERDVGPARPHRVGQRQLRRSNRAGSSEGTPRFEEHAQPVCAPALLRDARRPLRTPADLRQHTLLQVALPAGASVPLEWQPWLQSVGLGDLEPKVMLTFSNYDAAIAAAIEGQAVALGRRPLIDALRPAVRALEKWLLDCARGQATAAPATRGRRAPRAITHDDQARTPRKRHRACR